jgi:myo-inositol-1(or 4)-monophosphatase
MEVSIDFLKQMALNVYDKVHPLIGTEEAVKKYERGAGGDISMHIDIVAENAIIKFIERSNIDLLLISEEVGEKYIGDKDNAMKNQYKLIVDPIDGSSNAVRGVPFSSVSIAFAVGNKIANIEKAVVIDLTTRDLYSAERGQGAFLNGNKISVSDRDKQELIFEIDYRLRNLAESLDKYKRIIKKSKRIRTMGSCALSLCQVARGSMDAYINFKDIIRLVDAAAGILLVKEAGGKVFSFEGKDLEEELSINTRFAFIASNAKLEQFIKKELEKINSKE